MGSVIEKMDEVLSPMFRYPTCSKEFELQRYLTNHQKTHQTSKTEKLAKDCQRKSTLRMDPNYRKEEAEKNKDAKSKKRKDDPNYRKEEAEKNKDAMSKKRKDDPNYRNEEMEKDKDAKSKKRKDDPDYCK